ncbi:MAG: exosortase/archaeosortase family protein [Planctomycetota bacterium]|nr:exosortase/archaeosortase family protein [Planctomycetota bacterium]
MSSASASGRVVGVGAEGQSPWQVLPWRVWTQLGLLLIAFVALFHDWLWTQIQFSKLEIEDWGHAFVVPIISGAMLWQRRAEIARTPIRTFWPGALPLVLGVACYFFFVVGISNHMLQGFAMILSVAGVALLAGGPAMFRHLFLPIAFLVFAVKISPQIMTKVTFPLQLLASDGAYVLLRLIGSPGDWFFADVRGNVLEIEYAGRTIPLNVAEACSGMRMVIAFLALAAAVAIFACRHWWQRIALLLLAVPVALLMNIVRVAVLGLASLWDMNLASGNAHMLIGTLLLVPGMFLFLAVVWALQKVVSDDGEARA